MPDKAEKDAPPGDGGLTAPGREEWSDEETRRLFKMRGAGLSLAVIARRLGRTYYACQNRMRRVHRREERARIAASREERARIRKGLETLGELIARAKARARRAPTPIRVAEVKRLIAQRECLQAKLGGGTERRWEPGKWQ